MKFIKDITLYIKSIMNKNILFLLLSSFLFFIAYQLLLPTFPLYVEFLGGDEKMAGILTGLFALTAVFLRPYFGKLSDTKGRKYVLYIAAFTMMTGPILYLFDFGFLYLTLARIYHAISLAAYITASLTLLADLTDPEKRGTVIGIYGIASGSAIAVAPPLGIKIVNDFGFVPLFWLTALVGLLIIPCIKFISKPQVVTEDNEINTITIWNAIKNKIVMIPSIALFSITVGLGAVNAFIVLHGKSVGIKNIGIFFTVYSISSLLARLVAGYLSDNIGRKKTVLPGLIMVGTGILCLTKLPSILFLLLGALFFGVGFSTTHTSFLALIIDKTSLNERSQAVSFYANAFDMGISLGSMGLGVIAAYSYSLLWLVVASFAFMGFLLTLIFLPVS